MKNSDNTTDKKAENCSICSKEMSENIIQLFCGHKFHKECVKALLEMKQECPMCKKGVTLGCMRKAGVAPYDRMMMFD